MKTITLYEAYKILYNTKNPKNILDAYILDEDVDIEAMLYKIEKEQELVFSLREIEHAFAISNIRDRLRILNEQIRFFDIESNMPLYYKEQIDENFKKSCLKKFKELKEEWQFCQDALDDHLKAHSIEIEDDI